MKNKKLFAILTLLCFMMTLMPVAAFAADPTDVVAADKVSVKANGNALEVTLNLGKAGAATSGTAYIYAHQSPARQVATADVAKGDKAVVAKVALSDLKAGDVIGAVVKAEGAKPTTDEVKAVGEQTATNDNKMCIRDRCAHLCRSLRLWQYQRCTPYDSA